MKFFSTDKKSLLVLPFSLLLLASVAAIQVNYDTIVHPKIIFATETRYILPASIVTNFSFGFKNLLADLYWVKAIQDFSIWDGKDTFYVQEYKNIAALDPKFSYPYLLGILTFTSKSVSEKYVSTSTLETIEPTIQIGLKNIPENWEIPFYLGTGFQLIKEPSKALHYLGIAAGKASAPERVRNIYTSYLTRTITGADASRAFVNAIYETTESKTTKKILKEGMILADLTQIIQGIVEQYKNKYGVYPQSINEVISHKMIRAGTNLQNEFTIVIDRNTGKVKITSKGE